MFVYIFVIISAFRGSFGHSFAYRTCQRFSEGAESPDRINNVVQMKNISVFWGGFFSSSQTLHIQPLQKSQVVEDRVAHGEDLFQNKWIHQRVELSFDLSLMWMDSCDISSPNPSIST